MRDAVVKLVRMQGAAQGICHLREENVSSFSSFHTFPCFAACTADGGKSLLGVVGD
jgi:hypothetical protein